MKNSLFFIYTFFSVLVFFTSCKSDKDTVTPYGLNDKLYALDASNPVFSIWKLSTFEDNKKIDHDVSIELKAERNESGQFKISGKCAVNFYYATFSIDPSQKTIKIEKIAGTLIGGNLVNSLFEQNYLDRLSLVEKYELSPDFKKITLFLPEKTKQKLIFIH
jgi:META domain